MKRKKIAKKSTSIRLTKKVLKRIVGQPSMLHPVHQKSVAEEFHEQQYRDALNVYPQKVADLFNNYTIDDSGTIQMKPGEIVEYNPTTGAFFRYPSIDFGPPEHHRNVLDRLGDFVINVLGAFNGIFK